jgi:hypothetical protein
MAENFFAKWFPHGDQQHFVAAVESSAEIRSSLAEMFWLDEGEFGDFGRDLLGLTDADGIGNFMATLRAGCHAYLQFQDLLAIPVDAEYPVENRHYPYYESVSYLREIVRSVLAGHTLAAFALLRPWLELALTEVYFLAREEKDGLKPYFQWLGGERDKPPFRTMVDFIFQRSPARKSIPQRRYQALRESLIRMYRASCAYQHTPRQFESTIVLGGGMPGRSGIGFSYLLADLNVYLRHICYLYVIWFPMCLWPLPWQERFGFSPPVGFYFDAVSFSILQTYLGEGTVSAFRKQLNGLSEVKDKLAYFEERPSLSAADLDDCWERSAVRSGLPIDVTETPRRALMCKGQLRSLGWAMSYLGKFAETYDYVSDEMAEESQRRLNDWSVPL